MTVQIFCPNTSYIITRTKAACGIIKGIEIEGLNGLGKAGPVEKRSGEAVAETTEVLL